MSKSLQKLLIEMSLLLGSTLLYGWVVMLIFGSLHADDSAISAFGYWASTLVAVILALIILAAAWCRRKLCNFRQSQHRKARHQ